MTPIRVAVYLLLLTGCLFSYTTLYVGIVIENEKSKSSDTLDLAVCCSFASTIIFALGLIEYLLKKSTYIFKFLTMVVLPVSAVTNVVTVIAPSQTERLEYLSLFHATLYLCSITTVGIAVLVKTKIQKSEALLPVYYSGGRYGATM